MTDEDRKKVKAASPAASGPAGSHFEGQVGAHYLLSMLVGTEPRGLPGTIIDRIEFQRAPEGRPLDDIIVHAHDFRGKPAVLEIQVKRSITFTRTDPIFRTVVKQVAEAARRPDFWDSRYELAVALAKTSRKIEGAYQDVLTWARRLGSASTFTARIGREGSANDDMRAFVQTFKLHLHDENSPNDDETVWQLLRRLQILVFDFTAQGSASEELARERAASALHPEDVRQAANLWAALIELAISIAANGGDCTRVQLIEHLKARSFRLAGDRRHTATRAVLAEASLAALADIGDQVGAVKLTRHRQISAVHAALENGRYLEIRGDAGVGKSGILKHFADQIGAEGRAIVLSPSRTTPKGWMEMRAVLNFDGTARELLVDLAGDGGAILFIDNLDFFADEERRTVIDLVRVAADIPGFTVIATARRSFALEEPSWLPLEALHRLGRAEPVTIGELDETEIDELRHADPRLADLLDDNHPAREVNRNLFRLARLASRPAEETVPHTEVDMAEQWWRSADGQFDNNHRERARLLKALAEQSLSRVTLFDVSGHPAPTIDALVASETLRDLENDRVAFRHDVLREWAIAHLLSSDPSIIQRLPLDRVAPPALARGVELMARIAIERSTDASHWFSLLERFSLAGVHASWRRAILLALVRSEIASDLLTRASSRLLTDNARLLQELIRTVMAVDVAPVAQIYASMGIEPALIPSGLNVPSGPSYLRLILWLLSLGEGLPAQAIPDVVELYTGWSGAMLGRDQLTPTLLQWQFRWLTEIETAADGYGFWNGPPPFGGALERDRLGALQSDLRTTFLLFCDRTPDLAVAYLRLLLNRRRDDGAVESILKFRGVLAKAAPAELAELTASALIPPPQSDADDRDDELRGPFDYIAHALFPASPSQGPFLELLTHAPQHGLTLIRRLIDHAVAFYSKGRLYGSNAIILSMPSGDRTFSWRQTYNWSRDGGTHDVVASALMALEAWGHQRIEAGHPIEEVLSDVLGLPDAPAAYLLVAVDLLLSHWPKARDAAVPFLASPELLCLDRERFVHDHPYAHELIKSLDIFGLKALQKEPAGLANIESLTKRRSRQSELSDALGNFAVFGPAELCDSLRVLLRGAAERLGPPDRQSTLGDPALMALHALNLIDPNNWREVTVTQNDGTNATVRQYASPPDEDAHLRALREEAFDETINFNMQTALAAALNDRSRSSAKFAAAAVKWAQSSEATASPEEHDNWKHEALVTSALIAVRDGDAGLRREQEAWARLTFSQALQGKENPAHLMRSGLRFNPIAIACTGLIYLLRDRATPDDVRSLLEIVSSKHAAAHGFASAAAVLEAIDERLPRAALRCAFTACIHPHRVHRLSDDELEARSERRRQKINQAIDAEMAWLVDGAAEPDWPSFPSAPAQRRPGIRLPGGPNPIYARR